MRRFVVTSLLLATGCASSIQPAGTNQLTPQEMEDGWDLLFDGRTLEGWTNRGTAEWHVEDGAITVTPGTGGGHLATNRSFEDFRLQLDFYVDEESNSGVYVRAPENEPATVDNAYEVQIFDAGPQWQTGELIQVQENDVPPNTVNQWNHFDITVVGYHFTVYLNGRKTVEADAPPRLRSGVIILAPPQGEIRFRNIRIQELKRPVEELGRTESRPPRGQPPGVASTRLARSRARPRAAATQINGPLEILLRQRQRDQLAVRLEGRSGHDDVLSSVQHVGHRGGRGIHG